MATNKNLSFRLILVALLALGGAGSALAAPGQQAAPQPIAYGDTVTGSLTARLSRARYEFTARQGDVVTISLAAVSGDLDPRLQLLGPDGAVVAENDDIAFPNNTNALIERLSIPAAGVYTIVAGSFAGTSGDYELSLTLVSGGGGASPSLPTLPTAASQGAGALRFTLTWSGAADLDLTITDPEGNQLYWGENTAPNGGAHDSSQGNDFCSAVAVQPQETVTWEANTPTGDYQIYIQLSLPCNTTGAVPYTLTVEGDGRLLNTLTGQVAESRPVEDVFTYTGAEAVAPVGQGVGALRFVLEWSGAADLDLIVTDPAGNRVYWEAPTSPTGGALDSSQGNDFCETVAPQPQEVIAWEANAPTGEYQVAVQVSLPCGTTGSVPITITVDGDGAVLDVLEGEVSEGDPASGTFTYTGAGAVAPVGQGVGALQFALAWKGKADLDLVVTDPAGNRVYWDAPTSPTGGALDSSQGNDFCETVAPQPQEVIAWEANAPTGDYTIVVQLSMPCDTLGKVGFTVTVVADGQILDTVTGEVSQGNPAQTIFTYEGDEQQQPAVLPQPTTGAASYGVIPTFTDGSEVPLIDLSAPIEGFIDDENFALSWRIAGDAGDVIALTMTRTSGNLLPSVWLSYELPSGEWTTLISADSRKGEAATATYTLPETRWYIISATRVGVLDGATTGDFALAVQIQKP